MWGRRRRGRLARTAAATAASVVLAHCGGGEPPLILTLGSLDGGVDISGYVIKGPVSGATVTAYGLLGDLSRGDELATTTSDTSGFYGLSVPEYAGDVLLAATGGSYVEEALAAGDGGPPSPSVALNVEFMGLLLGYQPGQPATANITPVSHLAYALARYHVASLGEAPAQAVNNALAHVGAHFGNIPGVLTDLDWQTVAPSPLSGGDGAQLTAPERAAVILAGLSELAVGISTRAGISPGGQVNALSLLTALTEDLSSDGIFDGLGTGGRQLLLPADGSLSTSGPSATALDGSTVRVTLASAIAAFVTSSSNTSTLTIPDIGGIAAALSTDSDPYLFKSAGTTFDVVPPVLTVVTAPPPYTNQGTVTFAVAADDGPNSTGVKFVIAQTGDGGVLTGVHTTGNVWTFANVVTGGPTPYFDVWAVDNANNSGELLPVGSYHLHLPCLQDQAPPTIVQDFSVTSYFDERSMLLSGSTIPPQYTWQSVLPSAVGPGVDGAIWKSSVRLSWGVAQPTGANLESPNSENVPFLQIGIPFDVTTDAPIAAVTYEITVEGGNTSTGTLVRAEKTSPSILFFYLPLTKETIPALASETASPITFTVAVSATDAAGNLTTQPLESSTASAFTFHIIGPPLFIQEDANYSTESDAKSIYPFALSDGTYANKFAGDNGGEIARQARFIVYNPYPVAVPFISSFPAYETTGAEEWDDSLWSVGSVVWDVDDLCSTGPPCSYFGATPQPFVTTLGSSNYGCEAASNPQSHSNPSSTVFTSPSAGFSAWQPGAENVRPTGYADRILVPAAQAQTPGSIVIYVGRPWSSFGLPPYSFVTDSNPDGVFRYYRFLQDLWEIGASRGTETCHCVPNPPGPPMCVHSLLYEYDQRRWTNVLTAASETFSGTWAYESYAGTTPTSDLGDGAPRSVNVIGAKSY
jgi:hypothetical protein